MISIKSAIVVTAMAVVLSACGAASNSGQGNTSDDSANKATVDAAARALLPAKIRELGVLNVATDPSYPPCDFMDPKTNEIAGINHDLLKEIGNRLGIKVKQKAIEFSGLIPGVQGGQFDAAMECISDTAEREKQVTFIDTNYSANGLLTLAKNSAKVSEDPLTTCGIKVGVQTGTDHFIDAKRLSENCVAAGKPKLKISQFPAAPDVLTALQSGRIEALITSLNTAAYQAEKSNDGLSVWPNPMAAQIYQGIVVPKTEEGLAEALLAALKASIADGSYTSVLKKWNVESLALADPGINLATTRPLTKPELCGSCGK